VNETVASIQKILGVTADGIWGPKSEAALEIAKSGTGLLPSPSSRPIPSVVPSAAPTDDGNRVDDRSETAIATLHRNVQPKARQLVQLAAKNGIIVKITSGTRTYAEQDKLFYSGAGVTKARGGFSNHNFGLAFDLTIFRGDAPIWDSPQYKTLGLYGKTLGLTWGGDWEGFPDEPHMEFHPPWASGMSEDQMLTELRRRHDIGIDVFA
jgi:peptidoglycan L-alanyl-D-glutamate endopeptidase CwlK